MSLPSIPGVWGWPPETLHPHLQCSILFPRISRPNSDGTVVASICCPLFQTEKSTMNWIWWNTIKKDKVCIWAPWYTQFNRFSNDLISFKFRNVERKRGQNENNLILSPACKYPGVVSYIDTQHFFFVFPSLLQ